MRKQWISIIASTVMIFMLCCVSGCNKIKINGIFQLPNQSYSQMMSYIIKDKDTTIVIDGGTAEDSEYLISRIKEISSNNTVDAWFLTHYHKDHTGALASYLSSKRKDITIKQIYCQLADEKMVDQYEPHRLIDAKTIHEALNQVDNVTVVHKNDIFHFGDISVEVLRDIDNTVTNNYGNNTSIVYKVMVNDTSILFLGDLGAEASPAFLEENKDKIRNMDYLQLAHHGQAGGSKELYQWINPKYCLWPTPSWLYENKDGVYRIEETKEWISSLHVKKNYYAFKETDNEIEFNDK